MPKKSLEPRRRSKRIKDQVLNPEQEDTDHEEDVKPEPQSKGLLLLTPRNPIRGSSRALKSSRRGGVKEEEEEEEEEEITVRPVQVILQKMRAELPPQKQEEEENEDKDTPRSITPPPVVKEDLRPAMLSLQKLREKIPEEPRQRITRRAEQKIPTVRSANLNAQAPRRPSRSALLCCIVLITMAMALGSWYFLGSRQAGLKMDWFYSLLPWQQEACQDHCKLTLVESIPADLQYPEGAPRHVSIYQGWMDLLHQANETVQIAAFYFTLRGSDLGPAAPQASEGEEVFKQLVELKSRGISLKIAVNSPQQSDEDTVYLEKNGAEVRQVHLKNLTGGIVHTKLWVVDGMHVYVGSANMDWRSLTQVKELGVVLANCSCLAQDVEKVFGTYWHLGTKGATLPQQWPRRYSALSSKQHPLRLKLNGIDAEVYVSSAPPSLCASGRTGDLDAILSIIDDAQEFIFISVMDLIPLCRYCKPPRFWPAIDDRLRKAACQRGVSVHLLISCWEHSYPPMFVYLKSLSVLNKQPLSCPIQVRIFNVPATKEQKKIPFSRVNHNKYMVTDHIAYIGTSNWSEDYFIRTAGVGLIINQTEGTPGSPDTVQSQLKAVFNRDWDSDHALDLDSKDMKHCRSRQEDV
ncbi:5'-3' exonuclease PLD3-like isoform X2 [Carcharodon carcharias]|uniref:5'-3' exonuclease PLD3-like isoform X2 n=1 Tax=Carcharodon carcharias TaxID=13397 RepID=UPI001B7DDF91|nr:5'-3' exonuclease PLD3-like isoform X2 [Carcharodon carcharias]